MLEAMGAQLILVAQQILMVLGAREDQTEGEGGEAQGAQTGKAQEFKKMLTAQQAIMDRGHVRQRTVFYQKLSLSNS